MSSEPDKDVVDLGWDDLDFETKHELIALADTLNEDPSTVTRRDLLAGAGAVGAGALLGGGATLASSEPAAASHGGGTIGTASEPMEMIHTEGVSSLESLSTDSATIDELNNAKAPPNSITQSDITSIISDLGPRGELAFRSGDYQLDQIDVSGQTAYTLSGQGREVTRLVAQDGTVGKFIHPDDTEDVTIQDLTVDVSVGASEGIGVTAGSSPDQMAVERVKFFGTESNILLTSGGPDLTEVSGCYFKNGQVEADGGRWTFQGNWYATGQRGIYAFASPRLTIQGDKFVRLKEYAIQISDSVHTQIDNVEIQQTGYLGTGASPGQGIRVDAGDGQISNTWINESWEEGVLVQGGNWTLDNVVSKNNNQAGGNYTAAFNIVADDTELHGCKGFDDQGTPTQERGLYINGANRTKVIGGRYESNNEVDIFIGGGAADCEFWGVTFGTINDGGTRTRWNGIIGGGPLGGTDIGSIDTSAIDVGTKALADGTTKTAFHEYTWDGASWVDS